MARWSRGWSRAWFAAWSPEAAFALGGAVLVFCLALGLSWVLQRRLDAAFARLDARAVDAASDVLEELIARQGAQLASTASVLSEDARIRAMVLTPTFDQATVLDVLSDLRTTSKAGLLAVLDAGGSVRSVVGAPELDRLDLGGSALVEQSLDAPSSQVWAFADGAFVLAVSPVRADDRVLAFFMMGISLDDAVLQNIERSLGTAGAVFVGERMVAAARRDAETERALRAAAARPLSGSVVANVAWLAPSDRDAEDRDAEDLQSEDRAADDLLLTRALLWLPAILVGLVLGLTLPTLIRTARRTR